MNISAPGPIPAPESTPTQPSATVVLATPTPIPTVLAAAQMPIPVQADTGFDATFHAELIAYGKSVLPKANAARAMHKQKKMDHIVELVGMNDSMTCGELLLKVHISSAQMGGYLDELIEEGRLRYAGPLDHAHKDGKYLPA